MSGKSKKPWPGNLTNETYDSFLAEADLTEFDWGKAEAVSHEIRSKDARVTFRLPEAQLLEIKAEAARRGVKYQRFMREMIAKGMERAS